MDHWMPLCTPHYPLRRAVQKVGELTSDLPMGVGTTCDGATVRLRRCDGATVATDLRRIATDVRRLRRLRRCDGKTPIRASRRLRRCDGCDGCDGLRRTCDGLRRCDGATVATVATVRRCDGVTVTCCSNPRSDPDDVYLRAGNPSERPRYLQYTRNKGTAATPQDRREDRRARHTASGSRHTPPGRLELMDTEDKGRTHLQTRPTSSSDIRHSTEQKH
eukprot:gene16529-biopygen10603